MRYPGNANLSPDIRERVVSTFEHTLQLLDHESHDEALLGCDFILRLDPLFEPARALQARLRELPAAGPDAGLEALAAQLREMLQELRAAQPAAGMPGSEPEATPGATAPPANTATLHDVIAGQLERREFQAILDLAARETASGRLDPVLRRAAEAAQARLEAAPYVDGFVQAARRALENGDISRAEGELAKARALDPSHPGIAELETKQGAPSLGDSGGEPGPGRREHRVVGPGEISWSDLGSTPESAPLGEEPSLDLELGLDLGLDLGLEPVGEPGDLDEAAPPAEPGPLLGTLWDSSGAETEVGDARVGALLDEGQIAFDRRDFQGAIDSWSRIFLIDIDHEEANRRIELARKLKAESERKLEEVLHDGLRRLEAGDREAARQHFQLVLDMDPEHSHARDQLRRLDVPTGAAAAALPAAPSAGAAPAAAPAPRAQPPVPRAPRQRPQPRAAKAAKPGRKIGARFLAIGGLVLAAVAGGGWYLWRNWERVFPNSQVQQTLETVTAPNPVEQARALHTAGKTPSAVAQLRRVPPDSPHHAEAQALIARWETGDGEATPLAQVTSPEQLARRRELLVEAQRARQSGAFLQADAALDAAGVISPLGTEEGALRREVDEGLAPLAVPLERFSRGNWEEALPDLERMLATRPADPDVEKMIIDGRYNLGVRDLQRGFPSSAVRQLEEARNLAPDDPEIERLLHFAVTYSERPEDLQYRIFVKYLPFR